MEFVFMRRRNVSFSHWLFSPHLFLFLTCDRNECIWWTMVHTILSILTRKAKKKERSIFYFLSEHPPRHPHQTVASKDIITLLILENNAFSPYTKTHTHNTNQHLKQPCQILCSSLNKWPNILMCYYINIVLEKKISFTLTTIISSSLCIWQ